jgi:hypothetical protein
VSQGSQQQFKLARIIIGIIVVALLALALLLWMTKFQEGRISMKNVSNCRQVIMAIRLYSADERGAYPDAKMPGVEDSNTVLRKLFIAGNIEDEKTFACQVSPFVPDGDVGEPPRYERALEPGENHWAMTKGLSDVSPGQLPLLYENPAVASWPPAWNADAAGQPLKGRTWKGGRIIIGFNDASVEIMILNSKSGVEVSLPEGKNPFVLTGDDVNTTTFEVLDVAEK